ncbi:DUF2019 domain-containing protein [Roseixanthobacter pseudopolyaromaticivorans]|uniref:DUF2019 domain-containing protein n=1 Tax=Xanthobacteraceae TaxID=335928 RepID=UPI0037287E2E
MQTNELVHAYAQIGMLQYSALDDGRVGKYNRLYDEKRDIEEELKARPGDQRRALMALYDYPNMQVRLNAATATLAVAPEAARRLLQDIHASGWPPQCYQAGSLVRGLDDGTFKPT